MVIGALCAAAAVLLIVAGLAKFRTPDPAAAMIVLLWPRFRPLHRARVVARAAGAVEFGAGLATLTAGGRIAVALLAACYLVLTAVAIRLATGPKKAPCGCFGAADGTVGAPHVVLDLAGLTVAVFGCVRPPGAVPALFDDGALTGVTVTAQVLLLAALGYLSITALPALSAARREAEGAS
jgi:hypothetical protein